MSLRVAFLLGCAVSLAPAQATADGSPATQLGRQRGVEQAKAHAACKGCGMPTEQGLNAMSQAFCREYDKAPGAEPFDCRFAFVSSFRSTFEGIRGGPKVPIRPFVESDARRGLVLYDTGGNAVMTILRVDGPIMYVRHAKDGTEEPKSIKAMERGLYVKKGSNQVAPPKTPRKTPTPAPTWDPSVPTPRPGAIRIDY